ncbi:MAG TPA: SAM-dependent methyltransferase [Streptosporangiaceae bacterium]|nr:SAM-dependent methyltransferase [Streptosporangiaceae bacterium]
MLILDVVPPAHNQPGSLPARPGSYLASSHPAGDILPGQEEAQRRYNERVSTPQTLRTEPEVARFFDGLELVPPGVIYVHAWRPDPGDPVPPGGVSAYGVVARKP